jgi:hypothetical protein
MDEDDIQLSPHGVHANVAGSAVSGGNLILLDSILSYLVLEWLHALIGGFRDAGLNCLFGLSWRLV